MTEKIDIASMTKAELCDYFKSIGEPKFRAEQVFGWISRGASINEMTNLSKALREKLSETCLETLPQVEEKLVSAIKEKYPPAERKLSVKQKLLPNLYILNGVFVIKDSNRHNCAVIFDTKFI